MVETKMVTSKVLEHQSPPVNEYSQKKFDYCGGEDLPLIGEELIYNFVILQNLKLFDGIS